MELCWEQTAINHLERSKNGISPFLYLERRPLPCDLSRRHKRL